MQTQSQTARSIAIDAGPTPVAAVRAWLASGNADEFPYDAVVEAFHHVGKHVVATELLEVLGGARASLAAVHGSVASVRMLDRFLDAALDKWDGRYANPTYLALGLLPLSRVDDRRDEITSAERQYDRLFVQLIADVVRFEVAAADGATILLPEMRPDMHTTAKRCRLGLQAVGPALRRLGLGDGTPAADPIAAARHLWASVDAGLSSAERRMLQLTMLPVSLIHDEYQFIRVLQAYEATFALVAVQLRAAILALSDGRADLALPRIRAAETVLREAAPLFSLVATMRVEAFLTFREFTEGASAIQSRNYKLVESLCGQPGQARLNSPAYLSVPEVRQRVLAGQPTLDRALAAARAAGCLSVRQIDDLEEAMRQFAATLQRWRRTHHRLAVRMLGERTGTGYTEGTPYLRAVQAIPVFRTLAEREDAGDTEAREFAREFEGGDAVTPAPRLTGIGTRGRCPFSAGEASHAMLAAAGG